jgi:hypothetical protein
MQCRQLVHDSSQLLTETVVQFLTQPPLLPLDNARDLGLQSLTLADFLAQPAFGARQRGLKSSYRFGLGLDAFQQGGRSRSNVPCHPIPGAKWFVVVVVVACRRLLLIGFHGVGINPWR